MTTMELSLRRRAGLSRRLAIGWLCLAVGVLIGTYASLPFVGGKTLAYAVQASGQAQNGTATPSQVVPTHVQFYATTIVALGLAIIAFACFLLGRTAFVEMEMAARQSGLADALCVAESLDDFKKAADLLVPQPGYLSIPELMSSNTKESMLEIVKAVRK